jgi:hypothetical protein
LSVVGDGDIEERKVGRREGTWLQNGGLEWVFSLSLKWGEQRGDD